MNDRINEIRANASGYIEKLREYSKTYPTEFAIPTTAGKAADALETLLSELDQANKEIEEYKAQIKEYNCDTKIGCRMIEAIKAENLKLKAACDKAVEDIPHNCEYCSHSGEDYPDNAPHCDKCMKPNYNGGAYCSGEEWQYRGRKDGQ